MKKISIVIAVAALMAGSAGAALVLEYSVATDAGKDAAVVGLGTGVAASAGDVIVFSTASSKSYVKSYAVTSADGGVIGTEVGNWTDKNASVSYFMVLSGGTFDLGVAGNILTYDTYGAYVVGSDQTGYSVVELAQGQLFSADHLTSTTDVLDYGTVASGGILVESANVNLFDALPSGYNSYVNSGTSRATLDATFSAGALSSSYTVGGDLTKNARFTGIAFTEVVPEPATFGMLGLGALVMFTIRRFNRRRR